jgi:hypothetical protein
MKLLSTKQITITIAISFILTFYINNTFNPFELSTSVRIIQVVFIGVSFFLQAMYNDLNR